MSIDWITVAAQIANFLVLVWLLKRFLYRPILDGIDAREAEIARKMQEAVHAREKAEEAERERLHQITELNSRQADIAGEVRRRAESERDALLSEARKRLEQERAAWQSQMEEETRRYSAKLHRAAARALLSLTRKALTDLADETLEARIAKQLSGRLGKLAPDLRAAAGQDFSAVVSSREVLPQAVRDDLESGLRAVFPEAPVRFETVGQQPPGVILRIGGAELDWTVDGYVDSLSELLDAQLAGGVELGAMQQ